MPAPVVAASGAPRRARPARRDRPVAADELAAVAGVARSTRLADRAERDARRELRVEVVAREDAPGASRRSACAPGAACARACTPSVHSTYARDGEAARLRAAVRHAQQRELHRIVLARRPASARSRSRRAGARTRRRPARVPARCTAVGIAGSAPASALHDVAALLVAQVEHLARRIAAPDRCATA